MRSWEPTATMSPEMEWALSPPLRCGAGLRPQHPALERALARRSPGDRKEPGSSWIRGGQAEPSHAHPRLVPELRAHAHPRRAPGLRAHAHPRHAPRWGSDSNQAAKPWTQTPGGDCVPRTVKQGSVTGCARKRGVCGRVRARVRHRSVCRCVCTLATLEQGQEQRPRAGH